MTAEEIRKIDDNGLIQLILLREIAAQLSELNELLAASTIAKSKD